MSTRTPPERPDCVIPSITSFYFTAGKKYPVHPHETSDHLAIVHCDKGHQRVIALPVGNRCAHLLNPHPQGGDVFDRDRDAWERAGHFIKAQLT